MANALVALLENGAELSTLQKHFDNEKLNTITRRLVELNGEMKRNMFEIAARLLVIQNEELAQTAGYKDVFAYAHDVLGWKKNMVYKLIQAAKKFILAAQSENGKTVYHSVIAHADRDYNVSQLVELNAVEVDTVKTMNDTGVIKPEMSTKEIREAVKGYNATDAANVAENADNADDTAANGDNEATGNESETACAELSAIMEHCEKLLALSLVSTDAKTARKIKQFKEWAKGCVVDYKAKNDAGNA